MRAMNSDLHLNGIGVIPVEGVNGSAVSCTYESGEHQMRLLLKFT